MKLHVEALRASLYKVATKADEGELWGESSSRFTCLGEDGERREGRQRCRCEEAEGATVIVVGVAP